MDLSILAGPVVGAIIGYGTNWIAIKMLFRPLKPIKIGKFTLPFTPGIIPKRKDELAKAVGNSVGNNLFTKQDIKNVLLSDEVCEFVINRIYGFLESEDTIRMVGMNFFEENEYIDFKERVALGVTEKIENGMLKANLGEIIATEGKKIISEKVKGSMLKMFVTDNLISSIVDPLGMEVENYIRRNGHEKILPIVSQEILNFEEKPINEIAEKLNIDFQKIKQIYNEFINKYADKIVEKIDIAQVVENKIKDMDVLELEKLILSIMKKELSAIVNLGALIGLILGSINIIL